MERLLLYSGFPEPYLEASQTFYNLWEKSHINTIIRQDLIDLESPRNITKIETLIELLKESVGSPVSSSYLAKKTGGLRSKDSAKLAGMAGKTLYCI